MRLKQQYVLRVPRLTLRNEQDWLVGSDFAIICRVLWLHCERHIISAGNNERGAGGLESVLVQP